LWFVTGGQSERGGEREERREFHGGPP
jgi:hypothetical protein